MNLTVTTDNLGVVIPEILTKYGAGKAVGLSGKFTQAKSEVHFDSTQTTVKGNLEVTVSVGTETAILAEFVGIDVAGAVHALNGAIFGGINTHSLGQIGAFQTSLGLTKAALQAELQGQVDAAIAELNQNLTAGIVIPEIMGIDISDIDIKLSTGLLELGLSVTASFWDGVARFLRFEAAEIRASQQATYAVASPEEIKFLQY